MVYDVLIDDIIYEGITYAGLISLPLAPDTPVRRSNSDWMYASDCVELTHILVQRKVPSSASNPQYEPEPEDTSYFVNDDCHSNDYHIEVPPAHDGPFIHDTTPNVFSHPQDEDVAEERIFIPTAEYFKCKQKRKTAILGVCTLGLAGLSLMGVGNTWSSNIFAGTSLSANAGIGFVLKCLSFCLLTVLIAIPYFIYSVIALVYYSIRLSNLRN